MASRRRRRRRETAVGIATGGQPESQAAAPEIAVFRVFRQGPLPAGRPATDEQVELLQAEALALFADLRADAPYPRTVQHLPQGLAVQQRAEPAQGPFQRRLRVKASPPSCAGMRNAQSSSSCSSSQALRTLCRRQSGSAGSNRSNTAGKCDSWM